MKFKRAGIRILDTPKDLSPLANSGVSLHCHTLHSKEMLDFLPYYAEKIPLVSFLWKREKQRYLEREGRELPDFTKGFWLPPLTGHQVFESEKRQINDAGLDAIVSITDHDCIDANVEINHHLSNDSAPISMEWTVPSGEAFLHIGVHNLPPERAREITEKLLDHTYSPDGPDDIKLHELFGMLDEIPEVLIVLNHPVWDIEMIGQERHMSLLKAFVAEHGKWIHALEVNGFRTWSENKLVIKMAEDLGFPLVAGGDRHCCHQNTMINLTNSRTFAEYVEGIRLYKHSELVVMPEYREPLPSRQIRSIAQILKNYPEFPEGRQRWLERVHLDVEDGTGIRPLSDHWKNGGPKWLRWALRSLDILGHHSLDPVFKMMVKPEDAVPITSRDSSQTPLIVGDYLTAEP